jgi:tetratricopeptide (TPR) repeat protein
MKKLDSNDRLSEVNAENESRNYDENIAYDQNRWVLEGKSKEEAGDYNGAIENYKKYRRQCMVSNKKIWEIEYAIDEAVFDIGRCLEKSGRSDEAKKLYAERVNEMTLKVGSHSYYYDHLAIFVTLAKDEETALEILRPLTLSFSPHVPHQGHERSNEWKKEKLHEELGKRGYVLNVL